MVTLNLKNAKIVTLNCPNLHFSIPQEDILNDNSSEAMLQSCLRMSGLPLRRKPLRHDVQLVKFRPQRLAENPRHIHFDGVADKFFLLALRAEEHVVIRKSTYSVRALSGRTLYSSTVRYRR